MTWLNIAYGFLFFSNLVFMVGAAYLLYRILNISTQSRADLLKAANLTMEAGKHLKLAAHRTVTELDRVREAHQRSDNASSRAIHALSFKVQNLVDNLEQGPRPGPAAELAAAMTIEEQKQVDDMRAKLQAELNTALSKNHVLQEQIEDIQFRLEDASKRNVDMGAEISDLQGVKQSVVDGLLAQTSALETELQRARERALAAERQAEENAVQLDEIRARINEQSLTAGQGMNPAMDAGGAMPDTNQAALIEDQQAQIDLLASREKNLLAKIEKMELEFQQQKTEKAFIEDRFLQLDSASPVQPTLPGQAPESSPT
jgi:DNA repair exonuclease SbcCD ATPase subunit